MKCGGRILQHDNIGSGAVLLWMNRVHCVWIPAGLPCIFMTISVFNFDVQHILRNVTYVSWMVP